MFRFSKDRKRRLLWLVKIRRDKWQPTDRSGSGNLTEAEILERAAEERAAIVARYDRGRDKDNVAQIDPWEDPKFELYHVTDKYGFIHNERLPEKYTVHEAKVRDQENVRLNKWRKMLESWDKYYPNEKASTSFMQCPRPSVLPECSKERKSNS
ncbi:hypothetical protein HPB49_007725 [Dermacentor silvarum]|uniref:Uncharacterized protein n=1 Tax=Dermacentor silvarum TaxID=543639 RepID=A0ACB8C2L7_DERSI|nr:hypothetical protein HPB49_007725 [Dermacentor silvarum]